MSPESDVMSDHRGVPPDLEASLHRLEDLVSEAKAVPLSASIMLNRAEIEDVVTELREALPPELAQARWVLRERDEILQRAQEDGDRVVEDARRERDRLMSREVVIQTAEEHADRIIGEAREHARRIRLEAEDYVDAKLANFEVVLNKTLGAVEKGRAKLRGAMDADALSAEELDIALDEPDERS